MASTRQQPTTDTPRPYADASMQRVTAENGIEYAYREIGEGDLPLVLLQHFRGNLDNWDPALMDALAADRRVVAFDNVGVAATTGTTPNTVEAMAHDAIAFVEAMSFQQVDPGSPSTPTRRTASSSSTTASSPPMCTPSSKSRERRDSLDLRPGPLPSVTKKGGGGAILDHKSA